MCAAALLAVGTAPQSERSPLVIRMRPPLWRSPDRPPPEHDYKRELISLILGKTEDRYGPFRVEWIASTVQSRTFQLMDEGAVDLIITMTSRDREERLIPIRIPAFKGLYGWRLLVIREADRERFAGIDMLDQLRVLWGGQGRDWPDTRILEANGLQVDTAVRGIALYRMLAAGRIDYYPRGAHEPYLELEDFGPFRQPLVVEEHLALYYPAPGYIFVARNNPGLAARLEEGFRAALADGSFDRFFDSHPHIRECLERADLANRTVLRLDNPLLTPETPLDEPGLWFGPERARLLPTRR